MILTTLRYRIKDERTKKALIKMSSSVNFVWNYCNEVNYDCWRKLHKTYSSFDLNNKTSGCSKDLGLHSQTIQAIAETYSKCSKQFNKPKLRWRSRKRSLGWIPFKNGIRLENDKVIYNGLKFRLWVSRPIEGSVRFGSFSEDVKGNWFINLVIEKSIKSRFKTGLKIGIDLGLKTIATLSDGTELTRDSFTNKYKNKLAIAQRAGKKKSVKNIHAKIKNSRKDWNHKQTAYLTSKYDSIVVGGVSSSNLKKTKLAKSVSDAAWADFKRMLAYKAIALGSDYKEVNEHFSTVTCSTCGNRTGPIGQIGLRVRKWNCVCCGSSHNRDVNAAINILLSAQDIVRQREYQYLVGCQKSIESKN